MSAAVQPEFPEVHIAGAFEVLLVAFDQRVLAVGKNALWLVILAGRVGVIHDFLCDQVDTAHVRALVTVGAEGEFLFLRWTEVLRLQRASEGQVAAVDNEFLIGQPGFVVLVNDIGLLHS